MRLRHLTARSNVAPDGSLIDPLATRHGLLVGGRVVALAGPVDPLTHLNADFEQHGLERVAVVEALVVGAPALFSPDSLQFAFATDLAYQPRGGVDLAERRRAWQAVHTGRRAGR